MARRPAPSRPARAFEIAPHVENIYRNIFSGTPGLQRIINDGRDVFGRATSAVWERLALETFAGLYAPDWVSSAAPETAEDAWLAGVHEAIGSSNAADAIVQANDPHQAAAATTSALKALLDTLQKAGATEDQPQGAGPGPQTGLMPSLNENGEAALHEAISEAVDEQLQEQQELEQVLMGAGWSALGDEQHGMGTAGRHALMMALHRNPNLLQILELAGRFTQQAKAKRKGEPTPGPGMLVGTELGDLEAFVTRGLPSSQMYLRTPLRRAVMRDALEGRAGVYKQVRRPPSNQGPVIACLDLSGSMGLDLSGGQGQRYPRHVWAKGVLTGAYNLAMSEKRPFVWILFDHRVMKVEVLMQPNPLQLVEVLNTEPAGGTLFQPPIDAAADVLEQNKRLLRGADLLFFTDGVSEDPDLTRLRAIDPELMIYGFVFKGSDMSREDAARALSWADEVTAPTSWSNALNSVVDATARR